MINEKNSQKILKEYRKMMEEMVEIVDNVFSEKKMEK